MNIQAPLTVQLGPLQRFSKKSWTAAKQLLGEALYIAVWVVKLIVWDSWRRLLCVEVPGLVPRNKSIQHSLPISLLFSYIMVGVALFYGLTVSHAVPERTWALLRTILATPAAFGLVVLLTTVFFERPKIAAEPDVDFFALLWFWVWPGAAVHHDKQHIGRWIAITQLTCIFVIVIDIACSLGLGFTTTRDTVGDRALVYVPIALITCVLLRLSAIKELIRP